MGLMDEYIAKKLSAADLEAELLELISKYNKLRDSYMVVYVAAINKPIPDVPISQDDYYILRDLIGGRIRPKLDFYIETPGGSGETAEEIVKLLHSKSKAVSFVVSGEAKSAGTIIVLSGNDILMTETGSLGPIDAQVEIGRSVISAYDYIEWVNAKRRQAARAGKLNPFDATMVAQISPGELSKVYHSLKFAEDLVVKWLVNYKFRDWSVTETRKSPVTKTMKRRRAKEIAKELTNHAKWRSHGRSIKIDDLEGIGLRVIRIDDDQKLSNLIYRIQTVCRLLFSTTTIYKIFATEKAKIFKQAVPTVSTQPKILKRQAPDVVAVEQKCPKCGKVHNIYGKFISDPKIDDDMRKKKLIPFPKDSKLKCDCGFEIDLAGIRNEIEVETGRKMIP